MGIIKKLYHTTPVGETDLNKQEVYPITATSAVYSPEGVLSFPNKRLDQIIDSLNEGYQYVGLATPSTNPGTFDHKVYYLACEPGTYSHFGNITVSGLTVIRNTGDSWIADVMNITAGGGQTVIGGYIGNTPVQTISSPQFLDGITGIRLSSDGRIYFGVGSTAPYIEFDEYGFHFSHGLYSDGFVSAGGINTDNSSGGSIVAWSNYNAESKIVDLTVDGVTYTLCVNGYAAGGGGGGIAVETDPIFTASPAYGITAADINNWNSKTSNLGTVTSVTLTEGTGITISNSGTAITSSGTRTISLSSTYQNKISTLEGYFTNGAANNALTLNGYTDAHFAAASDLNSLSGTVASINNRVTAIEDWFEIVDGNLHVKNNRGLYSDSFISAGGLNSSSGGGSGVSYLKLLEDVYHSTEVLRSDGSNAQNGDFLAYDNAQMFPIRWVAKPLTSSMIITALGYTPYNATTNPNGYASGTITGILMNNISKGTSGIVDLGTVITSETDPVFSASAAANITSSDINNWNNKTSNIGTITGIIMNGVSKGTSGVVNLGTVLTEQSLANYVTLDTFNSALSNKMNKSDFRFDILCKSVLGNDANLNKIYDTSYLDMTGHFRYYAYVGANPWPSVSGTQTTAGVNGFPTTSNANALLTIDTYSESNSLHLYQMGFSGDGNIYFRKGAAAKENGSWIDPWSNGNWNRLLWEDYNGDVFVNGDVILQKGEGFWLDSARNYQNSAYIVRGTGGDYSLYIHAGREADETTGAHMYLGASNVCPNNLGTNLGSSFRYWNNFYANRWYPDPTNAPTAYIEWDTTNQAFKINGPVYSTGQVSAGGIFSNS